MSKEAAAQQLGFESWADDSQVVRHGRQVVATEARAVAELAERLDDRFAAAVRMIIGATGDLIVVGMGKAGHVAQKLAATFASTGTRAHFLHPAEAIHGDLGRVRSIDVSLIFSQSGETSEVLQLLPVFRTTGVPIIAVTSTEGSTLGRAADIVLPLGRLQEACSLGLAPSTSTTVMLAMGDALALTISDLRGFRDEDFARFHPGGSLGLKLSLVDDHMRPLDECRTAHDQHTVRQVLVESTKPGRRSGAVILTDASGRLTGLFTDSDLARLIEHRHEDALDRPICQFMAVSPTTIAVGERMSAAVELLADRKFSELPVVDSDGRPIGMVDVTDVVGLKSESDDAPSTRQRRFDDLDRPIVRIFPDEHAEPSSRRASQQGELPETD